MDRHATVGDQAGRVEQDVVALLDPQVGHGEHQELIATDPELGPHLGADLPAHSEHLVGAREVHPCTTTSARGRRASGSASWAAGETATSAWSRLTPSRFQDNLYPGAAVFSQRLCSV